MHDSKADPMLGTTYSADPTPGRHTTSGGLYYTTSSLWEKVSWLPAFKKYPKSEEYEPTEAETIKNIAYTSYKMLVDGTGGCYYAALMGVRHFRIFEFLNAATGWDKSPDQYMEIGRRMQTMRQQFNAIHGIDMESFKMHGRASGNPPLKSGHNKGLNLKIDEQVRLYRKCWGWDEQTGYPLESTLEVLGINELLSDGGQNG
jgi:aldehyde:ferredoxin oxidoreductase